MSDPPDRAEPFPPTACPFCGFELVVMTGRDKQAPLVDQYWRCERCQEVWNPGRLKTIPRRPRGNR
jgi:transposase-like protein